LRRHKRYAEKTSRELLVFCKLGLLLFRSRSFLGQKTINNTMTACVILHNIIIKYDNDLNLEFFYNKFDTRVKSTKNQDCIQAFL
jgi:hypothetical protein